MSFDLQLGGKRALVTGGTKGVGAATVELLVREGSGVHSADSSSASSSGILVDASAQQFPAERRVTLHASRTKLPEQNPEEPIPIAQLRPGTGLLEHSQLLAQRQVFEREIPATPMQGIVIEYLGGLRHEHVRLAA